MILARLSDAHTLGTFSLALAIAAPIFMATNMRLRFVQAADFSRRWDFSDFLKVRVTTSVIGLVSCLALCLLIPGDSGITLVLVAVGLFKAVEAVQDICIGACQQHLVMRLAALLTVVSGVFVVVVFSATFWRFQSIVLAAFALALVRLTSLLLLDVPVAAKVAGGSGSEGSRTGGGDGWRAIVAAAWPLGIVAALDSLNAGVPRYFLASWHGNAELGVYTAMNHVAFAGFVLVNAFGQSLSPTLARQFGIGDRSGCKELAMRLLSFALMVGGVGIAGVLLFGDWIIGVLYGEGFDVSILDFALVMGAGALSYISLSAIFVLSSAQKIGVQALVYGANFLTVVLLSAILVPRLSIAGAAVAIAVSHLVQALVSLAVISHQLAKAAEERVVE